MVRRPTLILAALAGLCLPVSSMLASPPTDEQLAAYTKKIQEAGVVQRDPGSPAPSAEEARKEATAREKARQEAAKDAIAGLNTKELTLAQIEKLHADRVLQGLTATIEAVEPRLGELSQAKTVDGARAAELRIVLYPRGATAEDRTKATEKLAELTAAALAHPAASDLFKSGKGDALIRQVGMTPAEQAKKHNLIAAVEPYLTSNLTLESTGAMRGLIQLINSDQIDLQPAARERIRAKIVAAVEGAIANPGDVSGTRANYLKSAKDTLALANGAWARGQLLGHQAPDIKFIWSNTKEPIRSFADLKGKVVVVDYWATWCGPCIASFPKIRETVAHYEGYPVAVLGVTSPQGFHIKRTLEAGSKTERIDCKDDLPKELALMPDFVKDMNITWAVAFSEQNVFNPDFGVRGIPHLAILDPAGKVRWNALHPSSAKEREKIDALLKEFNLPCPPPAPEEEKKADGGGE